MELTPVASLWLAILKRDKKLIRMAPEAARQYLAERGFPSPLIDAYLNQPRG